MSQHYVLDVGTSFYTSTEAFDTQTEAEAWKQDMEARLGVTGTLHTQEAWKLLPAGQAADLAQAKLEKATELKDEAIKRLGTYANALYVTVLQVMADVTTQDTALSTQGVDDANVLEAYRSALIVIDGLPTVAQVQAYDVVNDPAWPTVPASTSEQVRIMAVEQEATATTITPAGVWVDIDCTLTQQGLAHNLSIQNGNEIVYSGESVQSAQMILTVAGHAADNKAEAYRIGMSINGNDPAMHIALECEDKNGYGAATLMTLGPLMPGDILTPAIKNVDQSKNFDLSDIQIVVNRS